jgi:hypothetical protein
MSSICIDWNCFLQNREDFIDDSFPPSTKSLFYNPDDPSNHQVRSFLAQIVFSKLRIEP